MIAYDEKGNARGFIPVGSGRFRQWLVIPDPSRALGADEAGTGFLPLPFRADSVAKAYFFLGRLGCLFRFSLEMSPRLQ